MSLAWPQNGEYYASAYQISPLPYLSSSVISVGAIQSYNFEYVTKFVNVVNRGASVNDKIALSFTRNGFTTGNCITLDQGVGVNQEVRTTSLYISCSVGSSVDYQIFCGLTSIPSKNFLLITGSNGHSGVG